MDSSKQKINNGNLIDKVSTWSLIVIVQSFLSIIWLLLIPKEPGNAVFLGYSLRRLALLMPMAIPLLVGIFVRISAAKQAKWLNQLLADKQRPKTASLLVSGGALLAAGVWSFLFLFFFLKFFPDLGAYYRLIPWMSSYFLAGLEAVLFVPLFIYPKHSFPEQKQSKFPLKIFLIAFAILIAIFIVIKVTGLGKDPERFSIITLGVPILEGQIWYIIGLLTLTITSVYAWQTIPTTEHPSLRKRGDLIIATIIWMVAVVLWMSLPLPSHNYFAPEAQPPNFEKYPFSDAEQYDYNSLYVYYGSLKDFVVSKPMYVSLLAILHAIGGLSYTRIVFLQTLLVALFPSVLFIIGRELHSRLGGISIALFAIFHEVSSIQATSISNTSNTKLLLSDMPAALLASVLALTLIRWFKRKDKQISGHEFLIGGLIGIFILTRIQTMVLVPFGLILVIVRYFPKVKKMLLSVLLLLTALALVISPVLIRNHSITGVYWVDNPSSSQRLYTKFLDAADYENADLQAGTKEEQLERNLNVISTAFMKGFGDIMQFTADHFMRNSINSVLVMPVRLGNRTPFLDYLRINHPFWAEVYSSPNALNALLIIFNLGVLALGFAKAFKRNPWPVAAVLGLYVVYSLSSAVVRLSGWRFILPLEWVIYAFYALGIVEILIWAFRKIADWNIRAAAPWFAEYPQIEVGNVKRWPWYVGFGLLFLFAGGLIPFREHVLPSLLPDYTKADVCQKIDEALVNAGYSNLFENFNASCQSDEMRAVEGYGIYPRYFKSGEGFYDRDYDPWFGKQDYSRLVFRLIGTENAKIYIKTAEENVRFPNGAIVYAAGKNKNKFEAQFVLVEGPQPELIISSSLLDQQEALKPIE